MNMVFANYSFVVCEHLLRHIFEQVILYTATVHLLLALEIDISLPKLYELLNYLLYDCFDDVLSLRKINIRVLQLKPCTKVHSFN